MEEEEEEISSFSLNTNHVKISLCWRYAIRNGALLSEGSEVKLVYVFEKVLGGGEGSNQ